MTSINDYDNQGKNFDSLDQIQAWILSSILEYGEEVQPRGLRTLELCPVAFTLLNPRRRCIANPQRRWSLPLALGEFCWHISGSNKLQFIEHYVKSWREFSDDGFTIRGSCYGYKVFKQKRDGYSQWERLVQLLRVDPHSRRAVLTFSDVDISLDAEAKDIACACTLQFMIRSGKLHAFVSMRSNDAIWGLPYDVFLFTMLQELLACELGFELGFYFHSVVSLHLYERHFKLAQTIIKNYIDEFFEMPSMERHEEIANFLQMENKIRAGQSTTLEEVNSLHIYWRDLLSVINWYFLAKQSSGYSKVHSKIPDNFLYSSLLRNMVYKSNSLPVV